MIPTYVIIGNAISLIASILMVCSGYFKSKKRTLLFQTIDVTLYTLSSIVLKAYTGAIANVISIPRDILAYKEKLTWYFKSMIVICMISLSIIFSEGRLINLMPLIASVPYTLLLDKLKGISFKVLVIVNLSFWLIYDFIVNNYVAALFDAGTIITSCIAICRIHKQKYAE